MERIGRQLAKLSCWSAVAAALFVGLTPATAFTSAEDFLRSYDQTFTSGDIVSGLARIKEVDRDAALVTLVHEAVASTDGSLAMQEMSMPLPVANPEWLWRFAVGEQVRFKAARRRGAITLIWMAPAQSLRSGKSAGQ